MKGNSYKKLHQMSRFECLFLCQKAKRNMKREEKRILRKAARKEGKRKTKEDPE